MFIKQGVIRKIANFYTLHYAHAYYTLIHTHAHTHDVHTRTRAYYGLYVYIVWFINYTSGKKNA